MYIWESSGDTISSFSDPKEGCVASVWQNRLRKSRLKKRFVEYGLQVEHLSESRIRNSLGSS